MRTFRAIFKLEIGNFLYKRNLTIFFFMLLFSLILAQDGANSYKSQSEEMKKFVEVEDAKVKHYVLSTQYGTYGIRVLYAPTPQICLFNNNKAFDELVANVDVGERLNIYNSYKGNKLFSRSAGFLNFSDFLLIFGSILSIFYGYSSITSKDYLRFLAVLTNPRGLFFSIVLSRVILVSLAMTVIFVFANILILINGFNLVNGYTAAAFGIMILLFAFFIAAGTLAGMMKTRFKGFFACLIFLFVFFLVFPWLIDKAVQMEAELLPSNYKTDLEKFKLVMKFEKKSYKEVGIYRSGTGKVAPEKVKKLIKGYMKNEYVEIRKKENAMKTGMTGTISSYHFLHSLVPTTFCASVNCEISSKGFHNFIDFYKYSQDLKHSFFDHYIKQKIFEPLPEIKPFFKKKDYLFSSTSRVPGHFFLGLGLMLVYIVILLIAGQIRFRRFLFNAELAGTQIADDFRIKMGHGDNLWLNVDDFGVSYLYNIAFSEKKDFEGKFNEGKFNEGKFTLDGEDVIELKKDDFVYLCEPGALPGSLTPKTFFRFLKTLFNLPPANVKSLDAVFPKNRLKMPFEDLDTGDKGKALFTAFRFKPFKFYIFHDFFKGIPAVILSYFGAEINTITSQGGTVIYLSLDDSYSLYTQANRFAKIYKADGVYTFNELSRGARAETEDV